MDAPRLSVRPGAHVNPAVTIGLAVARRFERRDAVACIGVVAGLVTGGLLTLIAQGRDGFVATGDRHGPLSASCRL